MVGFMSDKKKILVVDDNKASRIMLREELEANGYEVSEAADGAVGLEKARHTAPDLIVLDVMLPKMDGYKVCGLLKADTRYNKIPVIIFTAKVQESDKKLSAEMGANAYVAKPFDPDELLGKISELLGG
jgi:DNA-binding response OmpR family regulator